MKIDSSEFGSITVDAKRYSHDVVCRLSGKIEKRTKELSKKHHGTSHVVSLDEAKQFIYEKACELLVVGTGQHDNMRLSPPADARAQIPGSGDLPTPIEQKICGGGPVDARRLGYYPSITVRPIYLSRGATI